eukprot:COSAG04_NODE_653_length_11548_cov_2.616910_3_plen_184_part_00
MVNWRTRPHLRHSFLPQHCTTRHSRLQQQARPPSHMHTCRPRSPRHTHTNTHRQERCPLATKTPCTQHRSRKVGWYTRLHPLRNQPRSSQLCIDTRMWRWGPEDPASSRRRRRRFGTGSRRTRPRRWSNSYPGHRPRILRHKSTRTHPVVCSRLSSNHYTSLRSDTACWSIHRRLHCTPRRLF